MPQFECDSCNGTFVVDGYASACPGCGAPARTQSGSGLLKGLAVFAIVGLLAFLVVGALSGAILGGAYYLTRSGDNHVAAPPTEVVERTPTTANPNAKPPAEVLRAPTFNTTIPFADQPAYSARVAELHYKFETGDRFGYTFQYEVNFDDRRQGVLTGDIVYRASSRIADTVLPALLSFSPEYAQPEEETSGSGFFVRPDGHLITNAHVVENAISISAEVAGETLPAKVVAYDRHKDLALLRVDASDTPYLQLSDSDRVRLSEDVRAFGYPMIDRLGSSIKITRGTIAGVIEQRNDKTLQLDLTINPGNSGGPVVDDQGRVVGVATSLMAGYGLADQGFAVTSNDVRDLLNRADISYQLADADANEKISGPDLADRVAGAVVLLNVRTGKNGIGYENQKVLEYTLNWSSTSRQTPTAPPLAPKKGTESGMIVLTASGKVVYCAGEKVLPISRKQLAVLPIQPLAGYDAAEWNAMLLHMVDQPGADATASQVGKAPIIESSEFAIAQNSADIVVVDKHQQYSELLGMESTQSGIDGKGNFEFSKRLGRPVSLTMKGVIRSSEAPATFNLTCTHTTPAEIARAKVEAERERQRLAREEAERKRAEQVAAEQALQNRIERIPITQGLPALDLSPPE